MTMRNNLTRAVDAPSRERGQAIIEFAISCPLLLLLLMGVVDYSRAIHAQSIITNMSREAANLVARANPNLSGNEPEDFQDVMNLIARTAEPLDMVAKGKMYITKVENVNNVVSTTSEAWGGISPTPPRNAPLGGLTLAAGQSVYVVEVDHRYESVFPAEIFSSTLYSYSIF